MRAETARLWDIKRMRKIVLTMLAGVVALGLAGTAQASEWGVHYAVGTLCFLVAGLMVLMPAWSPVLLGIFMTFNMTVQGLSLSRLGQR